MTENMISLMDIVNKRFWSKSLYWNSERWDGNKARYLKVVT